MRKKVRGTLQINEDVKRLFMLAKPLQVNSSDFLKGLLSSHAREVREAQQRSPRNAVESDIAPAGEMEKTARLSCLGRPPGAKDLRPRKRRTKAALARARRWAIKEADRI
jgi:hypothetical protein